ncbi:uncharacterized protein LOC110978383 [Acanthaster planci]|uniref:Uncharacterized protein LOC110978383 n=1 Tax=Acanthaster planci TaxID=133434 RepID=A0A8B7Y738_ACAPL|nr:uncharacterized protein LOC110978383 [Acanthaster planci]
MDFNKIEAEERHIFKLWTLCRVCGQAGEKLQYCLDNYADLLEQLYGIDLTNDDPAIHPQMVCQKCRLVLQQYLKKPAKSKKPPLPELYTFYKHSEECFVCDRASGLLPKRKLSIDVGELAAQAKIARQETGQSNIHDDKNSEDDAASKKENTEELSSQDTERTNVLLQALQGAVVDETLVANPEEGLEEPEQDGFTKYVYLNMIRRFKARSIKEEKAKESIDINRFNQKNFAYAFLTCALCKRLPLKPVSTECKHIFCEACISDWLNFGNVCPKCEEVIVELSDATEQLNHLYLLLDAPCSFASKGCEAKLNPFEIIAHEKECPYNDKNDSSSSSDEEEEQEPEVERKVSPRKRRSLRFVTKKVANSRVEDIVNCLEKSCSLANLDKIDVLFYILREALAEVDDARAKNVDLLWQNKMKPVLTRGRGRPLSVTSLTPSSARQLNRRKGTPRKRGRPRKTPVKIESISSEEDEEDEDEAEEEDLEEKDATWKPRSAIGRRQVRKDTEIAEQKEDEDATKEHDYSMKRKEAEESEIQGDIDTENVVAHVVIEDGEQQILEATVTVQ